MIIVTGANGQLGRAIALHLLARAAPGDLAVSVRDPAQAAPLAERGIAVRAGDFARPATLAGAFAGAETLVLVSSNAAAYGGDTLAQHRAAIDAARAAGVRRVVYTAHQGTAAASAFGPCRDHAATEALLAASGLAWTSLRNGFYASSGLGFIGRAFETGVIETPADGKVSWTDRADLAVAAAAVVQGDPRADGPTAPLTAGEALDFADLAALATEVLGRPIRRQVIADDDFRARFATTGAPAGMADFVLGFYRAARSSEFSVVDPTLERLLGRRPTGLRELIARQSGAARTAR